MLINKNEFATKKQKFFHYEIREITSLLNHVGIRDL